MSFLSATSCFPVRKRTYDRYTEGRIEILPYIGSGHWMLLADYD